MATAHKGAVNYDDDDSYEEEEEEFHPKFSKPFRRRMYLGIGSIPSPLGATPRTPLPQMYFLSRYYSYTKTDAYGTETKVSQGFDDDWSKYAYKNRDIYSDNSYNNNLYTELKRKQRYKKWKKCCLNTFIFLLILLLLVITLAVGYRFFFRTSYVGESVVVSTDPGIQHVQKRSYLDIFSDYIVSHLMYPIV